MENRNKVNFGDQQTPTHDALVFEAAQFFKKIYKNCKIEYEVPVVARGSKFIIGYIDLLITLSIGLSDSAETIAVEVKPSIASFGTLMRQLQTYKLHSSYLRKHVVYSHDRRFADELNEQGFEQFPTTESVKKRAKKS